MRHWQLQEAKNRFSEVVDKAVRNGPQVVTKRGVDTVVVMSVKEYQNLNRPKTSLVDFFKKSPLKGARIDLERNKDFAREVEF